MEHRSEPQAIADPVAPPAYGRGTVFQRTLRLLLRRIVYMFVVVLRPLRRFALFAVVVAALLGVIGWLGFQLWAPRTAAIPDTRAALVAPAASVENYIKGQQTYNADLMWDSLSPASQANQMGNGASKATMQSMVDRKREIGLQFSRYAYVGGQEGEDFTMFTYYVDVQQNQNRATFPMTFFVDKSGKVITIESPDLLNDMAQPAQ